MVDHLSRFKLITHIIIIFKIWNNVFIFTSKENVSFYYITIYKKTKQKKHNADWLMEQIH